MLQRHAVLLERLGMQPCWPRDGTAEALSGCATRGAVPDIILADYHLDGGTGLDAVAAVRARDER